MHKIQISIGEGKTIRSCWDRVMILDIPSDHFEYVSMDRNISTTTQRKNPVSRATGDITQRTVKLVYCVTRKETFSTGTNGCYVGVVSEVLMLCGGDEQTTSKQIRDYLIAYEAREKTNVILKLK